MAKEGHDRRRKDETKKECDMIRNKIIKRGNGDRRG